jgi:hypothetical protein
VSREGAEKLDGWIDVDEASGRIFPLPELDRATRARVRLVILGLHLNDATLRVSRRRLARALQRAWKIGDLKYVKEALAEGPCRLVSRKFLASKRPPSAPPSRGA